MHQIDGMTTLILLTLILFVPGWSLPYGERPSSGRRSYNVAKLSRVCGEGQRFALPQTDAYLECVGGVPEWRRCPAGFFFDAGTKSCTPANSRNPGSTRKSYQSQSSPFPENRRGVGVSSADRRSRPSFEKQERRQPHKELNSVDKKHEESGSAPVDRGANKEEIQDSITRRRENGLSTVHPNEQRRTRPLRCPDRAFKQATKRVVVAKEKPATRPLIPVRSTDSAAPISKASNVYTSSTKASTRRRTVKPMSPRRTTGSTVLKKTLTITSVSSGQTTALLQDRKAVSHSVRSSSTPANFKSTRKKGYTSSNAITSKALPENTTGRRWPQKWPAVRNEKSRPSSSTLPWTSAKIRNPHPTEGKDRRKYIPQSTTKSHQQEAKSNTGDSAKAASNFAADFVTWVSFVGIRSAAPEGKRTVNVTSSAPVRDETFASKIKTPQNGTTAATPRATESVHVTLRHGSDVPDGATTELPERSTWNTDVTGKRVLAVASKNVGRTEAPDSITQGTSTRDRHPQETAREDNPTENLENGTPVLKSNPLNSTPAYPPNEKFRDIVNDADIATPHTNLLNADAKLSTADALSQPAGTEFSDRRASTSVGLGNTGDLPLTTAPPSTESLRTPSSPIEVTHTRSTEAQLHGIEEVPANILNTVAVTRDTISYGDSQLAETDVNLPILTTPLPSTTTGDLPLTTALPSTESLKTPSSPIEVTHTRSTETHLNGIEEVPANILTAVAVTRETVSYGDSQLAETEVNLPILTTPLPSTTTLTTAPKITPESDSKVFLNTPKEEPTASNTEFTHATTASPAKTRTSAPDESYAKTTLNEERDLLFPSVRTEIGMTTSRSQETEASILSQTVTGATLPRTSETQSVYYQYTTSSLTDTPTYSKVQESRTTKRPQVLPAQTDIEAGTLGSDHPQSTSLQNALSTVKGVIETTTFAPAIVSAQASFPEEASQCQQRDCASTTGVVTTSPIPPEGTPPKSDSPTTVPSEAEELGTQLSKDSETADKSQEAEQPREGYEKNSVPRSTPSSTEDSDDYPHSIFPTEAGTSSAMSTKQTFEATSVTDTKENSNSSFVTSSVPHITIAEADNVTPAITSPTGTEIFRNQKELAAPHNAATTDISTFTGVPLETTIVENVAAKANLTSTTPNGGPGSPRVLSENDAPEVSIAMNGSKPSESDGISNKSTLAVLTTPHGVFELPLKTEETGESDRQLPTTLKLPTAHKEREALHTLGLEVTTDISNSTNFPQQETGNTYREGPRSDSSDTPNSATLSSQADSWETLTLSKTSLKNAEKPFLSSSTTSLQFEGENAVQENVEAKERGTTEQGLVTVTQAGFPTINQTQLSTLGLARTDPEVEEQAASKVSHPPSNTELPIATTAAETTTHIRTANSPVESESVFSTQKKETTATMDRGVSDSDVVTTDKGYQNNVEESSEWLAEELHLSKAIWRSKNIRPSMTMYLTTHVPRMPNSNTPHTPDSTGNDASEPDASTPTTPSLGETSATEPTLETNEVNITPSDSTQQGLMTTEVSSLMGTVLYAEVSSRHEEVSTVKSPEIELNRNRETAEVTLPELESDDTTMLEKDIRYVPVSETSTLPTLTSGQTSYLSSTEQASYEPSTQVEIFETQTHDDGKNIFTATTATPPEEYATSSSSATTSAVIASPVPSAPTTLTVITSSTSTKPPTTTTKAPICKTSFGLFRHPTDCNLFVHCSYSKPFVKKCPATLHFNEEIMVCDYPYRAGCLPRRT